MIVGGIAGFATGAITTGSLTGAVTGAFVYMFNHALKGKNNQSSIDINKNIAYMEKLRILPIMDRMAIFYKLVKNGGLWDYKQLKIEGYADLGNFNYGATGAALGIPEQVLLRAAGWAQIRAGTSDLSYGTYYGSAPYGDDPMDQKLIIEGINYYRSENWK